GPPARSSLAGPGAAGAVRRPLAGAPRAEWISSPIHSAPTWTPAPSGRRFFWFFGPAFRETRAAATACRLGKVCRPGDSPYISRNFATLRLQPACNRDGRAVATRNCKSFSIADATDQTGKPLHEIPEPRSRREPDRPARRRRPGRPADGRS